ncbi:MAG: DUF4352 domain-containing protein [Corynebacteriales bacterium]|nr:DUF4352 domain-containing protein [Mycobacteriales bacterium]
MAPVLPSRKRSATALMVSIILGAVTALAMCTGFLAVRWDGANVISKAQTSSVNEPASDERFDFMVSGQQCGTEQLGRYPQGQFCLVSLRVRNATDVAVAFEPDKQRARNSSGQVYDVDVTASKQANIGNESFFTKINPGNTVSGVIVFDIPVGQVITELELHDAEFSPGVFVRWPGARRTAAISN